MSLWKKYTVQISDAGLTVGPDAQLHIIYGVTGTCTLGTDSRTVPLNKGGVFLLNPWQEARIEPEDGALAAVVSLDCFGIRELSPGSRICFSREPEGEWYLELRRRVQGLLLAYTGGGEAQVFRELGEYYLLLHLLFRHFRSEGASGPAGRADRLLALLWESDGASLTLRDLASRLYLSDAAASRLFRAVTGESFSDYKRRARLERVRLELEQGDRPVTAIAVEAGFSSPSVFNRAFKEAFGVTPSQYRRQARDGKGPSSREEKNLRQAFEILEREQQEQRTGEFMRVTAQVSERVPWWRWRNRVLNVGAASLLQRAAVQKQVAFLAERLNIEYVRLWSLFSQQMTPRDGTEKQFNFSFLDAVLDFCVDNRLKLHLDLTQRRDFSLASERSEIYSRASVEDMEWFPLAEAFLHHIRRRYTEETVSQWVFEVTFYLNDRPYSSREKLSDLEVWRRSHALIKSVLPYARVAGPGLICTSAKKDLREIIGRYLTCGSPPDIFTTVNYPYDLEGSLDEGRIFHKAKRKVADQSFLASQAGAVRQALQEYGFEGEYWVTDWGFSLANRNYMQDSCFRGTSILKNMLEVQGLADAAAIFCASDILTAYGDSGSVLTGSAGLLSQNGIRKPAYYAYRFLQSLGRYQLCRTGHCVVTMEGEQDIRIVCFNGKALGHRYYLLEENAHRPDELDGLFSDLEPLEVEIELTGLPEGRGPYFIRQRILNERQGGPLAKWINLGCASNLSRGDIEFLERTSIPEAALEQREAEGGRLILRFSMEPNELRSIIID